MKPDFLQEFEFFSGVPDSQLKALCDNLMTTYGVGVHHIIAANEGNSTALAAGYYLATGKPAVVYLQNSGLGNIVNPVASLLNGDVYGIPCVFVVGWRGEPDVPDEPQHIYQGKTTLQLLEDMKIAYFIIGTETSLAALHEKIAEFRDLLSKGRQVAFVIKKNAFECEMPMEYRNKYSLKREVAIEKIIRQADDGLVISSTGKASRELFELRERAGQTHKRDFLTIGSMGHCSSIALGTALHTEKKVWCIDGDGAALMHMGAMAVIGSMAPPNMVHIVLNNGAHESVGGMPTAAGHIDFLKIAQGCGYPKVFSAKTEVELERVLKEAADSGALCFIEVCCAIGSRTDLGRPTLKPAAIRYHFMAAIQEGEGKHNV